jgi:hypothetical protein
MRTFLRLIPLILILSLTVIALPQQASIAQDDDDMPTPCPDGVPSRLVLNEQARVLVDELTLSGEPGPQEFPTGITASQGSVVLVLEGPRCIENVNWFLVSLAGATGWVPEIGGEGNYLLEPVSADPTAAVLETNVPVEFNNVRFGVPTALGERVAAQLVPPTLPAEEGPFWQGSPEYRIFLFPDAVRGQYQTAQLLIYPIPDFIENNPFVEDPINQLQTILEEQAGLPADEPLPFLPLYNAAQVFHSNARSVEFQNGVGIRYLTMYAQAILPVTNEMIFYTFQGITDDNEYYVSFIVPLESELLAEGEPLFLDEDAIMAMFQADDAGAQYDTYLMEVVAALGAAPPETFSPELAVLDALIQSLEVGDIERTLPPTNAPGG